MKNLKLIALLSAGFFLLVNSSSYAQVKKSPHPNHHQPHAAPNHHKGAVAHKSKFRPHTVAVFHPVWAPKKNINRRWVYFPKHNCYWDNWRNVYFYKHGSVWTSTAKKPAIIVNVNLENEKHYELNEIDDEDDEIFNSNESHINEYK